MSRTFVPALPLWVGRKSPGNMGVLASQSLQPGGWAGLGCSSWQVSGGSGMEKDPQEWEPRPGLALGASITQRQSHGLAHSARGET